MTLYSSLRRLSTFPLVTNYVKSNSKNLSRQLGFLGINDNASLHKPQLTSFIAIRNFHCKKFSWNMEFFTPSDKPPPSDPKEFSVVKYLDGKERPMALLFCWLNCKDNHVKKYVKFYTDMGVDVLKIKISAYDLYRPMKGSQIVARNFLDFLHANPQTGPLLIHGFSVGAYVFCESMVQVANGMDKHAPLLDRFIGQIWDSPVDAGGIPVGMPRALTDNKVLLASMTKYLRWYLKNNYEIATRHYNASSQKFHECFVKVPGLFLFSKSDPISNDKDIATVYTKWEKMGVPVFTKCWDQSPHVSHYHKHKKEYEDELYAFIKKVGFIVEEEKQQMSLRS